MNAQLAIKDQQRLKALVNQVIRHGVQAGELLLPDERWSSALRQPAAVFVTLYRQTALRGCIGTLAADAPLWRQAAHYAYQSAFADCRFTPLTRDELGTVTFSLSVLSPLRALWAEDEGHLLAQLQPGHHGLLLADGGRRAVFLPSVWQQLDDRQTFLSALKQKGGWPADAWHQDMRASVFTTFELHGALC